MPIRIKCPKCQTILGVKESLAGRKANCPKCRYMLTIPALKAAAAAPPKLEDAEALALSAFADEPAKAAPVSTKMIEFECPFCSEMVKLSADLEGKQAPCPNPECKRIIKVPLLKADKPKDWREMDKRGPTGALRKDPNEPEGTWSTAQKSRVSQEALLEADAIPVRKRPVSTATKVRRGIVGGVAFCILLGVVWAGSAWFSNKRLMGPFNAALGAVGPESKLTTAGQAEIQLGITEFYLLRQDTEKTQENLAGVYGRFPVSNGKPDPERDAVLLELMLFLIKYGSDAEEGSQLGWTRTVSVELPRALLRVSSPDAQQTVLRDVITGLLTAKQDALALGLADMLAAEAPAPVPPDNNDEEPKQVPKTNPKSASPLAAHKLALLYLKGEKDKAIAIADPKNASDDPLACLGWAYAHARKGELAEALKIAHETANPLHRCEALLAIAAIAGKNTPEAKSATEDARKAWDKLKATPKANIPVWLTIDLARACIRNDMAKEAKEVTDAIPEKERGARALAQLALLQDQLAKSTQEVPSKLVDDTVTVRDTLGYWTALHLVARHNTRLGKRSEALAMCDTIDDKSQPFVQIGVALGMLDARK